MNIYLTAQESLPYFEWNCIIFSLISPLLGLPRVLQVARTKTFPEASNICDTLCFFISVTNVLRGYYFPPDLAPYFFEMYFIRACLLSCYILVCIVFAKKKETPILCMGAMAAYICFLALMVLEDRPDLAGTLRAMSATCILAIGVTPAIDFRGIVQGDIRIHSWKSLMVDIWTTNAWVMYDILAGVDIFVYSDGIGFLFCLFTLVCHLFALKRHSHTD